MAKKPKKPEADDGEGESGGKAEKKGGIMGLLKNKLVLGGLALVILGGGGGLGAWKFGLIGGHKDAEHKEEMADGHGEGKGDEKKKAASFVDLPEMTVNLDSGEHKQYLRVKIALEVGEDKLAEQIKPLMPRVLDTFQTYLRALRPSDLEGSAGLFRLKEELTKRVNLAVAPATIDAVLFKEMMVQ
jgi:flagellar FliL protein